MDILIWLSAGIAYLIITIALITGIPKGRVFSQFLGKKPPATHIEAILWPFCLIFALMLVAYYGNPATYADLSAYC